MKCAVRAVLCTIAAGVLIPCGAQPPEALERWGSELGLTEVQIANIESIQYKARLDEIARRSDLERAELELDREMRKVSPDESAALRLFDALHDARGKLERSHLQTRLRIRGVLTTEQREKLEELDRRDSPREGKEPPYGKKGPRPPRPPRHE